MELTEKTLSSKSVFDGRILHITLDEIELPNGKKSKREVVNHPGGVTVAALDEENNLLFVRQFRYPYKEVVLELPAGKLEKDENPLDAAMRELREECGAVCDELKPLGEIYPSPGYTNEIIRLYACVNPTFVEQELDEDEFLQVCKMKLSTLISKIMSGEIKDAKTIVAAMKLKELRSK